jgi:hypothetical protein
MQRTAIGMTRPSKYDLEPSEHIVDRPTPYARPFGYAYVEHSTARKAQFSYSIPPTSQPIRNMPPTAHEAKYFLAPVELERVNPYHTTMGCSTVCLKGLYRKPPLTILVQKAIIRITGHLGPMPRGPMVSAFRPRGVPGPTSKLSLRVPAQMGRRETETQGGKTSEGKPRPRVVLRPGRMRLQ